MTRTAVSPQIFAGRLRRGPPPRQREGAASQTPSVGFSGFSGMESLDRVLVVGFDGGD